MGKGRNYYIYSLNYKTGRELVKVFLHFLNMKQFITIGESQLYSILITFIAAPYLSVNLILEKAFV